MGTLDEVQANLRATVDEAFVETARGLAHWPDPHLGADGGRSEPADEEYSRVTDPWRWRIVGARAEAWITALVDLGLGRAERVASVERAGEWFGGRSPRGTVAVRIEPAAPGALPIVIDLPMFDDRHDGPRVRTDDPAGGDDGEAEGAIAVSIGIGDPAVQIELIPDCCCDACDDGSQPALDQIDEILAGLVTSNFWQVRRTMEPRHPWGPRHQSITEFADHRRGCNIDRDRRAGPFDPSDGWVELTGRPWITTATAPR